MTDTIQSKENIQKYRSVFHHSMGYGMTWKSQRKFYEKRIDDIEPAIYKALEFVDKYNFGDDAEKIRIYAVSVLPFMMADEHLLDNPDSDTKKSYLEALKWLKYIKHHKGMANHHIYSITTDKYKEGNPSIAFDDFYGFDMRKLDKEIDTYTFLSNMKVSPRRSWWSGIVQVRCLAYAVHTAWTPEESRIKGFLADFFDEFESSVDDEVIKQKIIQKAKEDDFIRLNPTFLLDNIL